MPESLNTFLHTHPYKNMDSLKHISASLNIKIQKSSTADSIREKILTHAGDNQGIDKEMRNLAGQFKSSKAAAKKGKKASQGAGDTINTGPSQTTTIDSQQSLFTQEDSDDEEDTQDYRESLQKVKDLLTKDAEEEHVETEVEEGEPNEIDKICEELGDVTHVEDVEDQQERANLNINKLGYLVDKSVHVVASQ